MIKEERERGDGGRGGRGREEEREKEKESYKETALSFLNRADLVQGLVAKIMEEQPQEKQEHGSILGSRNNRKRWFCQIPEADFPEGSKAAPSVHQS